MVLLSTSSIVEDEATIAETIVFNLEREGYRATIAADGRTGLRLALQTPRPIWSFST